MMRWIDIVEAIDLMRDEIRTLFRTQYLGKKKNSADNQANFVGDLIVMMNDLARENVLDPDFDNTASIDVDAMRAYWESVGTDTSAMTDDEIKKKIIGREIYVQATFKPLQAVEGLTVAGTLE